jgi:hypothetical protein
MRPLALMICAASLHAGTLMFGNFSLAPTTEGSAFSGVQVNFSDATSTDTPASFTATINWGDGTTSIPTISGSTGAFSMNLGHTYAEEGAYTVVLSVSTGPGNSATATTGETVNDAPLTATAGSPFVFTPNVALTNILVLTFTDGDPNAPATDYTATINWGDGTTSAGTVAQGAGNIFDVTRMHTYGAGGTFTVDATANDKGGSTASAQITATATPEPGTIGMVCVGLALAGWKRLRGN